MRQSMPLGQVTPGYLGINFPPLLRDLNEQRFVPSVFWNITIISSETICLRLGLQPICWYSNPAKMHTTWFQDLMKLRFLMSRHRKNTVRDKVIGKKWIYSDSERNTLHRQCRPSQKVRVALGEMNSIDRVWVIAEGECGLKIWCD